MIRMIKKSKYDRILSLYSVLNAGEMIVKAEAARDFGVNERTIQRDIDDLRAFYQENTLGVGHGKSVVYDRSKGGYLLEDADNSILTNSEILAVCKILLESRSLVKEEMLPILDKLVDRCIPEKNKKTVTALIRNEEFHYIEPHHGRKFVDKLWDLGTAIKEQQIIEIDYARLKGQTTVRRRLQPVGIMVSEYYFYLTAFIDDENLKQYFDDPGDLRPTIYRIDRIRSLTITQNRFRVPYAQRFEEGEFRKRVQFMFGGKLRTVRFVYTGPSLEAVLDRLPTARVIDEKDGAYTVEAEVFGDGIEMWLRSQGDSVKLCQ
jgi:predicted DNA-binding transcriptional regulator YafY